MLLRVREALPALREASDVIITGEGPLTRQPSLKKEAARPVEGASSLLSNALRAGSAGERRAVAVKSSSLPVLEHLDRSRLAQGLTTSKSLSMPLPPDFSMLASTQSLHKAKSSPATQRLRSLLRKGQSGLRPQLRQPSEKLAPAELQKRLSAAVQQLVGSSSGIPVAQETLGAVASVWTHAKEHRQELAIPTLSAPRSVHFKHSLISLPSA